MIHESEIERLLINCRDKVFQKRLSSIKMDSEINESCDSNNESDPDDINSTSSKND